MTDHRLRPRERLRKAAEFRRVYRHRCSASDARLVAYGAENECGFARLGLSVSRKRGSAVRRNRLKRLLREAFRLSKDQLPGGIDLVLIPRTSDPVPLDLWRQSLVRLVQRIARKLKKNRE